MALKQGKITIVTKIDEEKETSSVFDGEIELSPISASVSYKDNDSVLRLSLGFEGVRIERCGEYGFNLHLKEGETLPAKLGISGSIGEIFTYTEYIRYLIQEKSFLLSLKYTLIFAGGEKQEMKIRLTARQKDEK